MIAKAIKCKGFRGALEYDLSKEQGRVIDTNMEGVGLRELARKFGEIYRRHEILMRAIERDFSLQPVRASIEAESRAATKSEIERWLRRRSRARINWRRCWSRSRRRWQY